MGYVIAAYTVVIGTLVVYGIWIHVERRSLTRQSDADRDPDAGGGRSG